MPPYLSISTTFRRKGDFLTLFSRIHRIWRSFFKNQIPLYAAAICYYLFLSSIQTAWLFIYVVSRLHLPPDALEQFFSLFLPQTFYPVMNELLNTARNRNPALIPFSVLTAIWSSSKTVSALWDGLNCHAGTALPGPGLKKRLLASLYYALLILILLAGMITSLLGEQLLRILPDLQFFLENPLAHYGWIFVLLCCFFTSIYRFLPKDILSFRSCLISGIAAASGWFVLTAIITGCSTRLFHQFDLSLLILFGLWLYNCMLILLYGRLAAKMLDEAIC